MFRYNTRELKKVEAIANKILALEEQYSQYTDIELNECTEKFKLRLNNKETLDDILVEAFAVCRESSFRVLGKKQYKVQLMGGIVLYQGRVAEMKTGEGKTLTELCPSYLQSLESNGVYILTVNEYLSERDKIEMEPLFNFLGLEVGLVKNNDQHNQKKIEYSKDIIYTTNTCLGFDYLRDNMVTSKEDKVLNKLSFVIIDEVDSVLIDEARTPLIISQAGEEPSYKISMVDKFVKRLLPSDYLLDEKEKTIYLSDKGIEKQNKIFGFTNTNEPGYMEITHLVNKSLYANYLMSRDSHYIVFNSEIMIVDENTGRVAKGRRFSDGLHQAIEAKEDVIIQPESETTATINYQNLFKLFKKVSGMSGTVSTEQLEFQEIYSLDVISIPTNKDIQRVDEDDLIFTDSLTRDRWFLYDVKTSIGKGQPVLISTLSIETSEYVSELLTANHIEHNILNAKNNLEEAEIVSSAGAKGTVTVATSMAGRGTDIKLSDEVKDLGGLRVIGYERSDSRRVDNQLIGRSGRQGDPGSSIFYISIEDKLITVYLNDLIKQKLNNVQKSDRPLYNKYYKSLVTKAQRTISGLNYEIRKNTVKYGEVLAKQMNHFYSQRDAVLESNDLLPVLYSSILERIKSLVDTTMSEMFGSFELQDLTDKEKDSIVEVLSVELENIFNVPNSKFIHNSIIENLGDTDRLVDALNALVHRYLMPTVEMCGDNYTNIIKVLLLESIDTHWLNHIRRYNDVQMEVRGEAYNQKDPVQIFQLKFSEEYNALSDHILEDFIRNVFNQPKELLFNNVI